MKNDKGLTDTQKRKTEKEMNEYLDKYLLLSQHVCIFKKIKSFSLSFLSLCTSNSPHIPSSHLIPQPASIIAADIK